jgi:hypothetical protein
MASKGELESLVARQTAALKLQAARIAELEADVARLNAVLANECDALQVLQRAYTDPSNPLSTQMRAAATAIHFERPRPPSVDLHLHGIAERLGEARQRYLARMEGTVEDPPDAA